LVCIVYSKAEETSRALGERVVGLLGAKESEPAGGRRRFRSGEIEIIELEKMHIYEENLDALVKTDLFIFLSRHRSSKGVASFTVHPLGNWADSSDAGGKPRMLSVAAPWQMRNMLAQVSNDNNTGVPVTYEATHHGPLLETPSFFVEVGGSEEITGKHYDFLARSVSNYLSSEHENVGKVAVAIGGTHYPEKFTKLALEGKYAFSHIMPRHSCVYSDMLKMGIERSVPPAECAVIDWKGIAAPEREVAIKRLGDWGVDYVRV
jgi:D-aminoacyl-tRNA deacylase